MIERLYVPFDEKLERVWIEKNFGPLCQHDPGVLLEIEDGRRGRNTLKRLLVEIGRLKKALAECCESLAAVDKAIGGKLFSETGMSYEQRDRIVSWMRERLERWSGKS